MRIAILLLLLAAALPASAQVPAAQPSIAPATAPEDPIAAILAHGAPGDEDEPDTAGQPRTAPEPEPSLLSTTPAPRSYTPAPQPRLDAPVQIDDTSKTPDGPPGLRDMAYDARIRSSFASAESFQGPLDGGWTLSERGGDRYAFQIVDRRDRLEAVWRDLRGKGSLTASGLVDDIRRTGGTLTLRFTEAQAPASVVTLHEGADGRWTGELVRGDEFFSVTLRRTGP